MGRVIGRQLSRAVNRSLNPGDVSLQSASAWPSLPPDLHHSHGLVPWTWYRRRRTAVSRKWLDPSRTPCWKALFKGRFPNNASTTASTLSSALHPPSFALEEVISRLSAYQVANNWAVTASHCFYN